MSHGVTVIEPLDNSVGNVNYNNEKEGMNNENISGITARKLFREFFRNFSEGNIFIYRESLVKQWNRKEYYIEVELADVQQFDVQLYSSLQSKPSEYLPYFEEGAKDALQTLITIQSAATDLPDFQVILKSKQIGQSIRSLSAEHVNKLVKVPGIIISCSRVRAKATMICIRCTECGHEKQIVCKSAMGGVMIPGKCESNKGPAQRYNKDGEMVPQTQMNCGQTPYTVIPDQCEYIDQQTLKIQEAPEVVPTGEMPRNIMLSVDRWLVDRITPGTRVAVIGTSSLINNSGERSKLGAGTSSSIRVPYIRVVGIQVEAEGGGRSSTYYSPQEEEVIQALARDPNIYTKLANSIAPSISGEYTVDIKKSLACLLMGGSRKVLPDGLKLRGDINVLLMGDPSTAKSQFLKFIERVAPVGVYTSGKGSSAAGLTASVIKDSHGEFFLEGGAMVLADGGVICIDEFDKMREGDRVAIHEAMEQQTISIAKAGITTVLNSRTAVLAAANPVFGRYDDLKSVGDNIDLMTTILSRFDCIFIVRDVRDIERDKTIARHVLGVHINASAYQAATSAGTTMNVSNSNDDVDIPVPTLKKYVAYCRDRCAPRLNDEAAALLSSQYVHIRNQVRQRIQAVNDSTSNSYKNKNFGGNASKNEGGGIGGVGVVNSGKYSKSSQSTNDAQVVPITVRQLEALVRLSEALAKMRLSSEATVSDVEEALRLFKVSTLAASQSNSTILASITGGSGAMSGQGFQEVVRAEEFLKRRMGLRVTMNAKNLIEEALIQGYSNEAVNRALSAMVLRNEILELNQRKILKRIR